MGLVRAARPRAPHSLAVPANLVTAPSAYPGFRLVVKDPFAIGILANLDPASFPSCEKQGKGENGLPQDPVPAVRYPDKCYLQSARPGLELMFAGHVKSLIERIYEPRRDHFSGGQRVTGFSQGCAQLLPSFQRKRLALPASKVPTRRKEAEPRRVVEPVRTLSIGIPFFAVDKIEPRRGLSVAFVEKLGGFWRHVVIG
jgi:hypothetical protein